MELSAQEYPRCRGRRRGVQIPPFWGKALVGSIMVFGLTLGCLSSAALFDEAAARADAARERLVDAAAELSSAAEQAEGMLAETEESDVADPAVLEVLDSSLLQANSILDSDISVRDSGGESIFDWATVDADARVNEERADAASEATAALNVATDGVESSVVIRKATDARDSLLAARDDAQATYDSIAGQVSDQQVMDSLGGAIATADEALSVAPEDSTAERYESAETQLADAVDAANKSHAAWQRAQEEAAAAERTASAARYPSKSAAQSAAGSGGIVQQDADGTWYVTYVQGNYVDATGGVTEYFDNYFVAHRSTGTNGQTIASRPATVVVDGVTYRYVSEKILPIGSDYNDIKDWATANNGIAFQTCDYSTGRQMALVLHYEPVS